MVGVVAAIGDQAADRSGSLQQSTGDADVVDIARSQQQDTRPTQAVAQRVELAGLAAARLTERLEVGPPFAPPAER